MIARLSQCDRRQLELALADLLQPQQSDELSRHLQACPHCQAELAKMAGDERWWADAKTYLSSTDDVVAVGGTLPELAAGDAKSVSLDRDDQPPLDFLSPSDRPGMLGRLGGYEIERVVGRGGMGVVLLAQDPALNRHVAIKVLAGHLSASAAARKRFAGEAQAAAAVVHDHVIPIHTVDTSGPMPFLVMPFVAGRSLQDRLDACGTLELKVVLRIAIQTAQGLAAAHAQGLVHRDIKPANILLEDGASRVRITDFGLARAVDDASQTQSGFIAGTPQYMAPEQARGEPIDARADLFSLGSVMYAMLTGHPPFRAETTLAVLRRICDDPPRDLAQVNPDVPVWLAAIAQRLLAKSPAERFQTADEVADLLQRWLAHLQQPTVIPPPAIVIAPRSPPHGKITRDFKIARHRAAAAIGASAAVLVAVASAIALWQAGWLGMAGPSGQTHSGNRGQNTQTAVVSPAASAGMSAAAIEAELDLAWQETLALETPPRESASAGTSLGEAITDLNQRLDSLERELAPRTAPSLPQALPRTAP